MDPLLVRTRRHFLEDCALGLGRLAFASLAAPALLAGQERDMAHPMAPRKPHYAPKAKSIIYLFMAGAPSQFELFDWKPKLNEYNGQPIPDSYLKGKRFAFMDTFTKEVPKLLATKRKFGQHGKSGAWMSELLPHTATVVDDLCFLKAMATDVFNHAPAKIFCNTGSAQFGRPSMGAWVTYGLGSESQDLPGFVVLQSGPRGPRGGAPNWGSGFLPTAYQGVPFRAVGDPILDLMNPAGIDAKRQADAVAAIRDLNAARLAEVGDSEIATRIAAYEMAYRMQTSAPELMDFSKESKATLEMYGAEPGVASFANNCLLARRLVERGVRFVQLYHTSWDHHGGPGETLDGDLEKVCKDVDQASAALVRDLGSRGLLDSTVVVWGGEFGRTPMGEKRETTGRNHHIDSYTIWLTGAGIKRGVTIGASDELGFSPAEDRVHVHDLQATLLHLLGLDHKRLTYRFMGRDFRLTDVAGNVVTKLLA